MPIDHYENFPVATLLCPRRVRPAVEAIYRYARTADDIADEGDAHPAQRLLDLAAYRADLLAVAAGRAPSARWPQVFEPLAQIIETFALPTELLTDLLGAFEQDVVKRHYADRAELLEYCRRSANPVGRLMLHLYGIQSGQALQQSDAICTALQLTNFWQDLGLDVARGRLYIPIADCVKHQVDPRNLKRGNCGLESRGLIAEMVGWARELMLRGAPLSRAVPGSAGWELRLIVHGGLRILEKIERGGYATLDERPALHWYDAPLLGWRAAWMKTRRPGNARKAA
ncbi:MAG: squalene synthase HpnC [Caldimonas sp.]